MNIDNYRFDIGHLLKPTKQMIHLWATLNVTQFLHWNGSISRRFVHIALLQGESISEGAQLAQALEKIYGFPTPAHDQHKNGVRWDGITDWLSDLSWLTIDDNGNPTPCKHYILCFHTPATLYRQDPTNFQIFIKVVCDAAIAHLQFDTSFHVILYPVDNTIADMIRESTLPENLCTVC